MTDLARENPFEPNLASQNLLFERISNTLLKNVSASTRRIYLTDAKQFATWLDARNFLIETLDFEQLSEYRAYLDGHYTHKPTAARKLVVVRRLLDVAIMLKLRTDNPAKQLSKFADNGDNETTHRTLNRAEVKALLEAIPTQASKKAKRDFALILLLLRTGLRRAEAASLLRSDIATEQGHWITTVRHGKGEKRRVVKLPVDVYRAISEYIEAIDTTLRPTSSATPLFVRFNKGDRPTLQPLGGLAIERIVEAYAEVAGLEGLTPHGLRATFVTITLENGATLEQVQYAAGHADPRTTERYHTRKLNLENNAVDYFRL
jgi:integrase/recombinase XerD